HDPVEVSEIGIHVERESVRRHPLLGAHANGRDLVLADPGAGEPRPPSRAEPVIAQRANQRLLQIAQVTTDVPSVLAQIKNPVAPALPRPVIRDVAAACGPPHRGTRAQQPPARGQQVLGVRSASERDHRRMLEEQKEIGPPARLSFRHQSVLQPRRLEIAHPPEPIRAPGHLPARLAASSGWPSRRPRAPPRRSPPTPSDAPAPRWPGSRPSPRAPSPPTRARSAPSPEGR